MKFYADVKVETDSALELRQLATALGYTAREPVVGELSEERAKQLASVLYDKTPDTAQAQLETTVITMQVERDGAFAARDQAIAEMWKARRLLGRTRGTLARMKKAQARRKR